MNSVLCRSETRLLLLRNMGERIVSGELLLVVVCVLGGGVIEELCRQPRTAR